jgi:hypothetical protein
VVLQAVEQQQPWGQPLALHSYVAQLPCTPFLRVRGMHAASSHLLQLLLCGLGHGRMVHLFSVPGHMTT